jgi:hypothetical protein
LYILPGNITKIDGSISAFTKYNIRFSQVTTSSVSTYSDGLDDLIIGAPYGHPSGVNSGKSYVVFGKTTNTAINLGSIVANSDGFTTSSVSTYNQIIKTIAINIASTRN